MRKVTITAMAMMTAAPAMAQPGWNGTYVFESDLGRDAVGQGYAIGVEHRLTLGRGGCRLTAEGFQSNEDIRCTATPTANGLRIAFKGYADGGTTNQYGVAQYKPGATLFTLTRGKRGVVTTWGAYEPDGIKGKSGVYFRKD
ncbi:DUF5991 domain-containing protein [uncultured Sphingomonas sp.]|uniref:DUF5991 domain-containing protein n=1 Tax=uncultured Sphingomonas sp. TaxID=158754 RepID=UPI0025DBBF6B|nr:DUF5991 domain-containing protein [uncultured Sphingomonas sp.]